MAKPQQAELRRSGKVPALDPDATETRLSGEDRPGTTARTGPVPEEQRPGHHPDEEQDKPDLDKFAARLGIVSDEEAPPEAPRVEEDSTVTRLKPKVERTKATDEVTDEAPASKARPAQQKRSFSPIGLALVGPVTGFLIAKRALEGLKRLRR